MIYVHENLLEALANEIRCEVAENLIAASTVCCDVSDVPAEIGDVVRVSGELILMGGGFCTCTIPQKALEGSLKDLIYIYLYPLSLAIARYIDQTLVNGVIKELSTSDKVHRFPEPTRETFLGTIIDAREALNVNLALLNDRHLLMNTSLETKALKARDVSGRILGFNTWLDYYVSCGMAWHKEAVTLASRPVVYAEGLTTFVTVRDLIGIQVTITPQENSLDYTLRAEARLGVAVPKPEFIAIIGDAE